MKVTQQTVTLTNGEELQASLVAATLWNLQELHVSDPIGFYELVTLCRDREHHLFGSCSQRLTERALIGGNGQPHDVIRSIVLCAVTGEGLEMALGTPVQVKIHE